METKARRTLGIFVREPVPGQVKTRLAAELGAERAAEIYSAFISDLADRFRGIGAERVLCYCPDSIESRRYFETVAGQDYRLWGQPNAGLEMRMQRFFEEHIRGVDDRAVIIGSDSPTLPGEYIVRAFAGLDGADCVIGPAADGGFYLIGMRGRAWPVFTGVAWSTSCVLDQTVQRLRECGACLAVLPVWYDVDTPDDWRFLVGHVRALALAGSPVNLTATRQCIGSKEEEL
ncbi:MAG: TIGR04282 family arsenosugar biosynthesis glycosyltransferase [Deltaproteobacteria bacterium]